MFDWRSFEINVKKLLEKHFKTSFPLNAFVNINGKHKKFIVIGTDRILVEKYVNEFKPWIGGVTIFYSDGKSSLEVIKS